VASGYRARHCRTISFGCDHRATAGCAPASGNFRRKHLPQAGVEHQRLVAQNEELIEGERLALSFFMWRTPVREAGLTSDAAARAMVQAIKGASAQDAIARRSAQYPTSPSPLTAPS